MPAPIPENEKQRLEKLKSYGILNSGSDSEFDLIAKILAKSFGAQFASISFIDEEREWSKASVGYPEKEMYRGLSLAAYSLLQNTPIVVKNTIEDDRFAQNPQVTSRPSIRFFAAAPIISSDGFILGAVTVADKKARNVTEEEIEFLRQMASYASVKLENGLQLNQNKSNSSDFEKNREVLQKNTLVLEKLLETTTDLVYLYNFEDKSLQFCNKTAPLPFAEKMGQLPAEEAVSLLARFEKFSTQDTLLFKFKNMEAREVIISKTTQGLPEIILGVMSDLSSSSDLHTRIAGLEDQLRKNALMFTSVLNSLTEGIIVADEAGTYLYFNSSAERLLGIGMTQENTTLWSDTYGFFRADKISPLPAEEMPLAKAVRGLTTDQMELFVRNAAIPQGAMLVMNGNPLHDEDGRIRGGIITFRNITDIRVAQEQLANINQTDDQTKLPNARALLTQLQQRLSTPEASLNFALAIIDIDQFQKINNVHGHQAGDRLILALGKALKWRLRKQDFLGRLKNDEFFMIFSDVDEPAAIRLAEGLKKAVVEAKETIPFTISVGLVLFDESYRSNLEQYIESAENALAKAKASGMGTVFSGR
jgi:diguanylate cyclase (GGDEF)-like protein